MRRVWWFMQAKPLKNLDKAGPSVMLSVISSWFVKDRGAEKTT